MSLEYIREHYGVHAKRGTRVEYTGGASPEQGTIKSAKGGKLMVLLDGHTTPLAFHPTWKMRYLVEAPKEPSAITPTLRQVIQAAIADSRHLSDEEAADAVMDAIDGDLGVYEDVYEQLAHMIGPFVGAQNYEGALPGSVVESMQMLLENHRQTYPMPGARPKAKG